MSLSDPELRALVRGSLRSAVRSDRELTATLDDLGWRDVVSEDAPFAYESLFSELGSAGAATAALDQVVLAALAVDGSAAVLYPRPGSAACGRIGGEDDVVLAGLALREITAGTAIAAPVEVGARLEVAVFEAAELVCTPLTAWQRDDGAQLVELVLPASRLRASLTEGDWTAARAAARRCLAHELLGIDARILELGVDHVRTREQFGRALGSFQAVRHRLAEIHVQLTAGRQLAHDAWRASDADLESELSVAAKAYAGRAHRIAAAHAMQVCGAIGLTWEHPLADLVRRGFFLDALLGDERSLGRELGQTVADPSERALPAVLAAEQLLAGATAGERG